MKSVSLALSVLLSVGLLPAPAEVPPGKTGIIVATDYPSLQAAVDEAEKQGGQEISLPAGKYVLEKTLDLTHPSGYGARSS